MAENDTDTVEGAVKALEAKLGVPVGFLEGLKDEDDWSFVIKAHAFLEAAITHLLVAYTDKPALGDIFAQLELSNNRTGKIAFAEALDAINEDERRFTRAFSEIRNTLVHNVKNVGFSFAKHLEGRDTQQRGNFVKAFSYFTDEASFPYDGKTLVTADFVREQPKKAVWFCVMVFAGVLNEKAGLVKLEAEVVAKREELASLSKLLGKTKTQEKGDT